MKKILLLIVSFICTAFLLGTFNGKVSKVKLSNEEILPGGEDAREYFEWEHRRLADPATGRIPDNIRAIELAFAATLPNDAGFHSDRALSTTWQQRGPWNVGGRTRAFAADVKNEAILLAGTTSGGMWRSIDSGKNWTLQTPLAIQQGVCCVAQDMRSKHSNIWYYGSGEAYGASASAAGAYFSGNGIYRSKDDGITWTQLPKTNPASDGYWSAMWDIAADSSKPDSQSVLYAATLGSVYRSADTGNTWKAVLGHGSPYSYFTDVKVTPKGVVYATLSSSGYNTSNVWADSIGAQSGLWRSINGTTFTKITPPGFPTQYNRVVIGVSPTDENQVYFLVNTVKSGLADTNFLGQVEWNELWKYKYVSGSGDSAGGQWFNLTANLPHTGGYFDKYNCQGSYDMVVSFLPNDTATVFIGGTDIFRSTTGFFDASHTTHIGGYKVGASLPAVKVYPGHHPDQHVIFFSNSNPYIMYSGCDGGVFRTMNDTAADSVTWNPLDIGYITTMFYTAATDHTRPGGNVLIGGAQDNNSLFDNSPSVSNIWTKPIFGDGSYCYIEDTGKVFYYSSQQGKMFKAQMDTTTGTITAFNRIDPIGGKGYQFVNPYVIDPNNNALMYLAGGKYLWRNNNLAGIPYANMYDSISTNWMQFPDSVPIAGATITSVAVSTTPANRVYYGTDMGRVYRIDSANTGTPTPKDISKGLLIGSTYYVTSVSVDPNNADNVIVAYSNYGLSVVGSIFYSSNGGASWTKVSATLGKGPSVRWVTFMHPPLGGTIYWAGTSTGLYATDTLEGTSTVWVQQGTNSIGNAVCDFVDVRQADGLVAVATHAHGIYTGIVTSSKAVMALRNLQPPTIQLNTYPNPSTGLVHISFTLPNEEMTEIKIYDLNGKLVKEFSASRMAMGDHIVDFDATGEPAGIYFCTVQAGGNSVTSRMVLVK